MSDDPHRQLTTPQAVEALSGWGMDTTAAALEQRRARGSGPRHVSFEGGVRYLLCDLESWARTYTRSFIDLQRTALGRWMIENNYTAPTFAAHLELGLPMVRDLLGHRNKASRRSVSTDVLRLISLETGIPVGTLVEDAMAVPDA